VEASVTPLHRPRPASRTESPPDHHHNENIKASEPTLAAILRGVDRFRCRSNIRPACLAASMACRHPKDSAICRAWPTPEALVAGQMTMTFTASIRCLQQATTPRHLNCRRYSCLLINLFTLTKWGPKA
jgi:hypothetical protein